MNYQQKEAKAKAAARALARAMRPLNWNDQRALIAATQREYAVGRFLAGSSAEAVSTDEAFKQWTATDVQNALRLGLARKRVR